MSANRPADARLAPEPMAPGADGGAGRPFLLLEDPAGVQLFVLPPAASVSVGRLPTADLVLDADPQVSRLHARFERVADGWDVVDDGPSRNGTFVNGERVSGRRRLCDVDALRFGATAVTFRLPGPGAPHAGVGLSTTQRRVLAALCRPCAGRAAFAGPAADEQIAEELFLTVAQVRAHLAVLNAKLGVEAPSGAAAPAELAGRALSAGWISDRDL